MSEPVSNDASNGSLDDLQKSRIYSSLLYQIINNLNLSSDKKKMDDLIAYLREIFCYTDKQHAVALKEAQMTPKPIRSCRVTVIKAIDFKVEQPVMSAGASAGVKNRFFVTAGFENEVDDVVGTKFREDMDWNESLKLPLQADCKSQLEGSLEIKIWNNLKEPSLGQKLMDHVFSELSHGIVNREEIIRGGKKHSKLLGKATIPFKAIKPAQQFTWSIVDKRNPDNRKSLINLRVVYTMENLPLDPVEEYSALLEILLRYELTESGVSQYWWDGKFTNVGESLLTYYRADKDLSQAEVKLAQWRVYCKVQADYPLAYGLFNDVLESMESFIERNVYNKIQLGEFWAATTKMLEYTMGSIEAFRFDNEKRAMNMMKVLNRISRIVSMSKLGLYARDIFSAVPISGVDRKARNSIEELVVDALRQNVRRWFGDEVKKLKTLVAGKDFEDGLSTLTHEFQRVKRVSEVVDGFKEHLEMLRDKYQGVFKRNYNLDLVGLYATTFEDVFIPWACQKVSSVCHTLGSINFSSESNQTTCSLASQIDLAKQLKALYFNIKALVAYIGETVQEVQMKKEQHPLQHRKLQRNFQSWFNEAVPKWLDILAMECSEKIDRAFVLNQGIPEEKYTTSAKDTFDIVYCFVVEWRNYEWALENHRFTSFSETAFQKTLLAIEAYVKDTLAGTKLSGTEVEKAEDMKAVIQKLGLALNNIEFLMGKIEVFIEVFVELPKAQNEKLASALEKSLSEAALVSKLALEHEINCLIQFFLDNKFTIQISRVLKEGLASLAKDPQAINAVLAFLDEIMPQFNDSLTEANFKLMYDLVWREIVSLVHGIVEKDAAAAQNIETSYFSNFGAAFLSLCDSFSEADATEETQEKSEAVRKQLCLLGCPSEVLIHSYFASLKAEYDQKREQMVGQLTILGEFTDEGLRISVLNGRDLQPHPTKVGKKPDTYVEVQFVFKQAGVHIKNLKTKTQNKNDFPLYDESFTIALSEEVRNLDDSLIVFTLWDPDMFGVVQNYLSESYVTFSEIRRQQGRQVHLRLVKPQPPTASSAECVRGIRTRTDKYSKEFIRVLKIRTGTDNNLLDVTLNLNKNLSRSMKNLLLN